MNFLDLRNRVYRYAGYLDLAQQLDWDYQDVNDAINNALEIVSTSAPFTFCLLRESTLTVVPGQQTYYMDDWSVRGQSYWTQNTAAHKIRFRQARNADRNNLRNPGLTVSTLGPFDMTWSPSNTTPVLSGASGASTGATAVEGSQTVSFAGAPGLTAAHVGRMLKLNGEYGDYKVTSVGGSSCTVDRPIKSRIQAPGLGSTHLGSGYTNVRWEIGPKLRLQIMFLPTPSVATTVFYRYAALPRRLLNDDDEPELRDEWHHLLWMGALKFINLRNEDNDQAGAFAQEFESTIAKYKTNDDDDQDSEDPVHYETHAGNDLARLPVDTYPPRGWQ